MPTDQQHVASKQLEVDRTVSGVQRPEGESLCRTCGKMCRTCQDAKMPGGVKGMYPAPHIHEHLATAY